MTDGIAQPEPPVGADEEIPAPAKKRGRPAGQANKIERAAKSPATTKKRGRPKVERDVPDQPLKKRARPSKKAVADAVPPEDEQPTPKKRGRPPYGGETTKQDDDDEAAAEQLEDELINEAEGFEAQMKTPVKKGAKQAVEDDSDSDTQYWLMKSEQVDRYEDLANGQKYNSKFTIDDLKAIGGPEPWDGVRNPTAAKNMRAMKKGDLAFFYASNGKVPAIVGIMEIVKEHEPDQTAWDMSKPGYVPEEKNRGKWCVVHVQFRQKFDAPITRTQLQQSHKEGPLANMQEFTAARLSVSKVSSDEWDHIMDLAGKAVEVDAEAGAEDDDMGAAPAANGDIIVQETSIFGEDLDLPTIPTVPVAIMTSTEPQLEMPEMPTTDTIFPVDPVQSSIAAAAVLASSRPTSRGSRAGSAGLAPKAATAGSRPGSRAGSRAGSLAPPGKRARSKTPLSRAGSVQPPSSIAADVTGMPSIGEE